MQSNDPFSAPRDARFGGAFMRGPASGYRPGYEKMSGPLAGLQSSIAQILASRAASRGNMNMGGGKRAQAGAAASPFMSGGQTETPARVSDGVFNFGGGVTVPGGSMNPAVQPGRTIMPSRVPARGRNLMGNTL